MCNCIKQKRHEVEAVLQEKYCYARGPFQSDFEVEFEGVELEVMTHKLQTFTPIRYKRGKRTIKSFIPHRFCPFCGKPYSTKSKMKPVKP